MEKSTDGGIIWDMNTFQNPKLVAFVQTVFYSCAVVVIPLVVNGLQVDGVLYTLLAHVLPPWAMNAGVTGAIIWALNYYDNKISAKKGGAMFGTMK